MIAETVAVLSLLFWRSAGAFEVPPGADSALLVMPDGFKVRVELAVTPEEKSAGLMFRRELREDRGMLFVFREYGRKYFWMKNTYVELDMVFLNEDLEVERIFHRVTPSSPGQDDMLVARVSSPGFHVLELAGGVSREHDLGPGSRLKIIFPAPRERTGVRASSGTL